jgi:hypothetical protein
MVETKGAMASAREAKGETPEDQLSKQQAALIQRQSELDEKNKLVISIKNQIEVLKAGIADVNQTLAAYDEASLRKKLEDSKKVLVGKTEAATCAVKKEKQDEIKKTVDEFDKALTAQGQGVKTAFTDAQTAREDSENADKVVALKQAAYDDIKKGPDPTLKGLKTLLDSADQAQIKSDYISLYFYVIEAQTVSDSITIQSKGEYTTSLQAALNELDAAKQDAFDKKAKADQLGKDYTDAKQKYEAAQASRRTDLLKLLRDITPQV